MSLTAIGAYQLGAVLLASERLRERDIAHSVVAMLEPGRFRRARCTREAAHVAPAVVVDALYPSSTAARLFVCHTRPEPMLGVLAPLLTDATRGLGFTNAGGTLGLEELLFVNGSSWAHVLDSVAALLGVARAAVLTPDEIAALDRRRTPAGVITPDRHA